MTLNVAICGYGAIGRALVKCLHAVEGGLRLACVVTRTPVELAIGTGSVRCVGLDQAFPLFDVVVDCAAPHAFDAIVPVALAAGKIVVTVNAGALATRERLFADAGHMGGRLILASGAVLGLDGVRAAREGGIHRVTLVTRKPPASLAAASARPAQDGVAAMVFQGTARAAVSAFPENMNVAATLSFAGVGLDRTQVEIWADPACTRNEHHVTVEGVDTSFSLRICNHPSADNPKTSLLTAGSVLAALKAIDAPVRIGS